MEKSKAELYCPLFIFIIYALVFGSRYIGAEKLQYRDNYYLSLIVLQLLVFILPAIIFCRLKGTGYAVRLNLRPVRPAILGTTALGALLLISGSWLIRLTQIGLTGGLDGVSFSLYNIYYPASGLTIGNVLYVSLTFAVLPAVTEEFVFRSLLFTEYTEGGFGFFTVTLLTSLLFSMLHFSTGQFGVYLFGGIVLCCLTYAARSALPAILCHFLYNMYAIFGEPFVLKLMKAPDNAVLLLFIMAVIFLLALIGFLGEAERLQFVSGIEDEETPGFVTRRKELYPTRSARLKRNFAAWISPFFLLCVVFYFVVTKMVA